MKKTTLFNLVVLMVLSFSVSSYASFLVHPAPNQTTFSAVSTGNENPETKPAKKRTGTFGIVAIIAGAIGCLLPAGGAVIAILLGIGAGVFGIMGMGKKRKLKG